MRSTVITAAVALACTWAGSASAQGLARVWAIDDGERIRQDDLSYPLADSADNLVWDGQTIRIFSGRNEIVAFQVILESGDAAVDDVTVTLESLTSGAYTIENTGGHGDPFDYRGKRIELFTEHYVEVTDPSAGASWWWHGARPLDIYDADYVGWLPDALVPFEAPSTLGGIPFSIAPLRNQAVWVDVYVPRDAPAGTYSGDLTVTVGGSTAHTIPVELEVYAFTLPDETHFKNYFFASEGSADGREGIRTKHPCSGGAQEYEEIVGRYHQMAHRHRMDLTFNADLDGIDAHYGRYITGEYYQSQYDYEGPGEGVAHGTYSIGTYDQPNSGWRSGFWPNTEADWRAAADAWVTWFEQNSPQTEFFKYFPDEPMHDPDTLFPIIKERADWLHNNPGPGASLMVYDTVKLHPELYGYVDFWSVTGQAGYDPDGVTAGYDVGKVAERQALGEKVGVYNTQRPGHGAVEAISADATEARVTPWIGHKYAVDHYFLWETVYWNYSDATDRNIFQTVSRLSGGRNGNGFFFYPGEELDFPAEDRGLKGPIASMRMKNWRRGQQDYEYLWLAAQAGFGAEVDAIVEGVVPRAFNDYGDGFESQSDQPQWARRGYQFESARRQLAELLASVGGSGGGVPDGGSGGSVTGGAGGSPASPAAEPESSDCGCRLAGAPRGWSGWLLLVALVGMRRRRA